MIPAIKQEKKDGTYTSNPYIAFRKRTEKMQTRKVCICMYMLCVCDDVIIVMYDTSMAL